MSSPEDRAPSGDLPAASLQTNDGQAARPAPSQGYAQVPPGGASAGKVLSDGRTVYRTAGPLILCWCWAAVALFALADLVIQGHDRGVVAPALIIVVFTGVVYASAWRPRVEADSDGITVQNPFRDYRIPWGAVKGVFLGDSVEVQCARRLPKGDKTVYCWALFSSRRSRARASYHSTARRAGRRSLIQGHSRLPDEAQKLASKTPSEIIAAELGSMSSQARANGHTDGIVTARWPWQPVAAILIPALALALALLL